MNTFSVSHIIPMTVARCQIGIRTYVSNDAVRSCSAKKKNKFLNWFSYVYTKLFGCLVSFVGMLIARIINIENIAG